MKRSNAAARIAVSLAATFALVFSPQAGPSDKHITTAQLKKASVHKIHIVDKTADRLSMAWHRLTAKLLMWRWGLTSRFTRTQPIFS